jgi:hypothetical protein
LITNKLKNKLAIFLSKKHLILLLADHFRHSADCNYLSEVRIKALEVRKRFSEVAIRSSEDRFRLSEDRFRAFFCHLSTSSVLFYMIWWFLGNEYFFLMG